MITQPRCPECDIELDCSSDRWVCPLCEHTPKFPAQIELARSASMSGEALRLRDVATEAAALIGEIALEKPQLRERLADAYRLALEIAERADQDAGR